MCSLSIIVKCLSFWIAASIFVLNPSIQLRTNPRIPCCERLSVHHQTQCSSILLALCSPHYCKPWLSFCKYWHAGFFSIKKEDDTKYLTLGRIVNVFTVCIVWHLRHNQPWLADRIGLKQEKGRSTMLRRWKSGRRATALDAR